MESSYNSPTTKPIYKGIQIIWYVLGLIEALLAFRFIFKIFDAKTAVESVMTWFKTQELLCWAENRLSMM